MRFYNYADVPVDQVVQMMVDETRKYPMREIPVSNPTFMVVIDGIQVDYDKAYRFAGSGVRLNQGGMKATQRLTKVEVGKWKITAEFDREIRWSTQLRDPILQWHLGTCR